MPWKVDINVTIELKYFLNKLFFGVKYDVMGPYQLGHIFSREVCYGAIPSLPYSSAGGGNAVGAPHAGGTPPSSIFVEIVVPSVEERLAA